MNANIQQSNPKFKCKFRCKRQILVQPSRSTHWNSRYLNMSKLASKSDCDRLVIKSIRRTQRNETCGQKSGAVVHWPGALHAPGANMQKSFFFGQSLSVLQLVLQGPLCAML
jgi:hypothetical protein